jgi:influenza virus NS1A-binding protein
LYLGGSSSLAQNGDVEFAHKELISQKSNESTTNSESQFSIDQQNNTGTYNLTSKFSSTVDSNGLELIKLPKMSVARCSHGVIAFEGKLYIVGGYDRGECLDLCEVYDPTSNQLSKFEPMLNKRGRAAITWLENQSTIFCVGGSNGHEDLNSIEYYDMTQAKWTEIKFDFELGCTNLGAIACEKYVYLVGLKDKSAKLLSRSSCLRYEPTTNTFHRIAGLNNGRSQSALVWIHTSLISNSNINSNSNGSGEKTKNKGDNLLFVFGGHDQIKVSAFKFYVQQSLTNL